jgi:hypothetical protein
VGHDQEGTGKQACVAASCYGTAQDQGNRVGCCTANGATNLEYEEGNQKDPFYVVDGIEFANKQLGRGRGNKVRLYLLVGFRICRRREIKTLTASVPSYIFQAVKFIGNGRNGSGDDGEAVQNKD